MAKPKLPKYRVTIFHPPWYWPWGDHNVSIEVITRSNGKYTTAKAEDVGVFDSGPYPEG